jgi:hypothetical protein
MSSLMNAEPNPAAAIGRATMPQPERGMRVTDTDAWSRDAPFSHTARKFAKAAELHV